MTKTFEQSEQWEHITSTLFTQEAVENLESFRSGDLNYKLALWNPQTNGVRYLKDLIYNLGMDLSEQQIVRLRRIHNRQLGRPISVHLHGEPLCLDYLQAVLELDFLDQAGPLEGARVLEIGAGYGRTCHALLSNHDLAGYTIIDLPHTLQLSRRYLKEVLDPRQYERITFLSNHEASTLGVDQHFDLCVNINSFGEMPAETVRNYLHLIAERCTYFYTKNQVGKYLDKSLDGHSQGQDVVQRALRSGLLRDIIDIYDAGAVAALSQKYIDALRPAQEWSCVADRWAKPWSFYWQALYHRELPA